MREEGAMVTVEGSTLAETTRPSHEESDPSSEDPGQGSHSRLLLHLVLRPWIFKLLRLGLGMRRI